MQAINVLAVIVAVALTTGCDQRTGNAIAEQIGSGFAEDMREMGRQELAKEVGPIIVASLVGGGAPPGGPLGMLGMDAGWDARWQHDSSGTPIDPTLGLRMFFKNQPLKPKS
jgi:hypothetical protein